jgi:uncharacterized membrane protein
MEVVKETHLRTLAKSGVYRISSVTLAICLTLVYGATLGQALSFGVVSLIWGLCWFYMFDRLWLLTGWKRNQDGQDSKTRSIIKAVIYRLFVVLFVAFSSRIMWTDSNFTAMLMAGSQFMTNILTYFLLERIWNRISWGKIFSEEETLVTN